MRKILILLIIVFNFGLVPAVWGASCALSALDQFDYFLHSPIVFRGKVLSTFEHAPAQTQWGFPFGGSYKTEIKVTKVYKGSPESIMMLNTDQLSPGREFIFFPRYDDSSKQYSVTWCGDLVYPVRADHPVQVGRLDRNADVSFLLKELEQISSSDIKGKFVTYYANGNPKVERNFRDDILSQMMDKGLVLDGTLKTYYEDGTIRTEEDYIHGQRHGPYKLYYPNGKLQDEYYYVKGKVDGVRRTYREDGSLDKELHYQNGAQQP